MTTILVVHGTGTRNPRYNKMFNYIQGRLGELRPDLNVAPCPWGNSVGCKLHQGGASIPLYDATRGVLYADTATELEALRALWGQLYEDPLYELRLLSVSQGTALGFIPGRLRPGQMLDKAVQELKPKDALGVLLNSGGLHDHFDTALSSVTRSEAYKMALQGATETLGEYKLAVARAIVAATIAECNRTEEFAALAIDADLRDNVVQAITDQLAPTSRNLSFNIAKHVFATAVALGALNQVQRKRGALTDTFYPSVGDVLLYQGRGEPVRQFILNCILAATPPVVVLAHSLGGVASLDLLVMEDLSEYVPLLITVGSQAPFLYELNALHSLEYGQPLPVHFPEWLNIYDLHDFLSYVGSRLFPNHVQDVQVDNRQPFPRAHSAYWANAAVWKTIVERIT
jgi:hypothetical protein